MHKKGLYLSLNHLILFTNFANPFFYHHSSWKNVLFNVILLVSVVTTIRHHESMQNSSLHLLLINLCFSNLLTSFLVKPISAIYSGYSLSVGTWQVNTELTGDHLDKSPP